MPLNIGASIYDLGISQGWIPKGTSVSKSFDIRKRKWDELRTKGLVANEEYRGSEIQNPNLIRALSTPTITPSQFTSSGGVSYGANSQPVSFPATKVSTAVNPQTSLTTQQLIDQTKAMLAQTQAEGSKPFAGSSYDIPLNPTPVTVNEIQNDTDNKNAVPQQFKNVIPEQKQMSAEELLAAVRAKPGVQLAEQAAGLDKESIARQIEAAKAKTAQKSAESGTAFSPAFHDQPLAALDAEKVAKDLNVDISVARIITSAMQDEQNAQLKEATAAQKAIEAYYKTQGKQINPMTGLLEDIPPTAAELRAEETAVRSEERLALSEEAALRAERSLAITEARFAQQGEIDESEIDALANTYNRNKVVSEIPSNVRGEVLVRAKEIATEDLNADIQEGIGTRNITPEELIPQLQAQYPEFSSKEITDAVNQLLPTIQKSQEEEEESFWKRLWGGVKSKF